MLILAQTHHACIQVVDNTTEWCAPSLHITNILGCGKFEIQFFVAKFTQALTADCKRSAVLWLWDPGSCSFCRADSRNSCNSMQIVQGTTVLGCGRFEILFLVATLVQALIADCRRSAVLGCGKFENLFLVATLIQAPTARKAECKKGRFFLNDVGRHDSFS